MPYYDFQCPEGHKFELFVKLENFEDPQHCTCGNVAQRIISRPMILVENVDYSCPITGESIRSKRQHEENLKLHGCRVFETGEKESNEARRQQEDQILDRRIEETVERTIDQMPSDKKEKLANALSHGADIQVERN